MKRRMEIVVLIGIPGSGKTTFCLRRFHATHLRINLDMLATRKREQSLYDWCLAHRQSCVIDDTNATRAVRARWIGPAREAGVPVTGCFMESDVGDCLQRNHRRQGRARVPDVAIHHIHSQLQPPSPDEGFSRLLHVAIRGDDYLIEEVIL